MIADNLGRVRERIASACASAARPVQSVTLLVVGKTFPGEALRAAFAAGASSFGENQVQEALEKMDALADLRGALAWHLVGPLQANKTRLVAERFDWAHSIDRLRVAERLSAQRPEHLAPLSICLQVNTSGEASKHGLAPEQVAAEARRIAVLPRLALRGLMAIPAPAAGFEAQRRAHRPLRELFEALRRDGLELDTLSMGMSDDLEAAIVEGATMVRVGSAIFGERPGPP